MLHSDEGTPSKEALNEKIQAAIALASAAVEGTHASAPPPVFTPAVSRNHVRPPTGRPPSIRRQSISSLPPHLAGETFKKGAQLTPVLDGARLNRVNEVAAEIASNWHFPQGTSQYDSAVLHQVRAILYMNKSLITQSFVSHVSGVSQGSLSHYVRGLFRGNQTNVEERLTAFVQSFVDGTLDNFLQDARSISRPIPRQSYDSAQSAQLLTPSNPVSSATQNEPLSDTRVPIPPPPPPQLHPVPWARPPPPPVPPALPNPTLSEQPTAEKSFANVQHEPHVENIATSSPLLPSPQNDIPPRVNIRRPKITLKRPRLVFPELREETEQLTPVLAVERAYHALVATRWTGEYVHAEPLLIPVEVHVAIAGRVLHTFLQWDVNERKSSPELAALHMCTSRDMPDEFVHPVAMHIRRTLFEAGVICPPPPDVEHREKRCLITINMELQEDNSTYVLQDEFEWDLGAGCLNSPEFFAQHLCIDANISQKHTPAVAREIRQQIVREQAIAYGDEATKMLALEGLDQNVPRILPGVSSWLLKSNVGDTSMADRKENEVMIRNLVITPLVDGVAVAAEQREQERIKTRAREKARKENEKLKRKREQEIAEYEAKLEATSREVEEKAVVVYQERNLDFRPYLGLRVGRGERPSLWMPAAFDRRRRRQLTFPMVQSSKRSNVGNNSTRPSKRRRPSRRDNIEDVNENGGKKIEEGRPVEEVGRVILSETKAGSKRKRGSRRESEDDEIENRKRAREMKRSIEDIGSVILRIRVKAPKGKGNGRREGKGSKRRRPR